MNVKSISIVAALIASFGSTAALAADEYTLNQNLPTATVSAAPRAADSARLTKVSLPCDMARTGHGVSLFRT